MSHGTRLLKVLFRQHVDVLQTRTVFCDYLIKEVPLLNTNNETGRRCRR